MHIFIRFRNSSLENKNTKRSLIYGTKSYKNIHCGSLRERGATWWLYLSAGAGGASRLSMYSVAKEVGGSVTRLKFVKL